MRRFMVAVALAFAGLAAADTATLAEDGPDRDIGGVWQFRIGRGGGTIVLNFGIPLAAQFSVRGYGCSLAHRASFGVSDDVPSRLAFLSNGRIQGTVNLEDEDFAAPAGTLEVQGGSLNATNDRAVLQGVLTVNGRARRVVLRGVRRTEPTVDLQGGSFDGVVSGRRIASRKLYVAHVKHDFQTELGLDDSDVGYPFFDFSGIGPVSVDRQEVQYFSLSGTLVLDAGYGVSGRVTTSQFGAANVSGNLRFDDRVLAGRPIANLVVTPDSGRAFRVRAPLQVYAEEP